LSTSDLSRWNRAGLSRFRYVDGNAVEYLEQLRADLLKHFPGWKELQRELAWAAATPNMDPEREAQARLDRLVAQYDGTVAPGGSIMEQARRGSITWEMLRTFARACHILTETVDAYANEGFLGTATQWEHVRRLVEMLGYHPAPPASASTPLVLIAKPGKAGTVDRGLQVKHAPEGAPAVVFETLANLAVDHAFNGLRLAGHGRSPAPLVDRDGWIEISKPAADIKVGEPLVIEEEAKPDNVLHARLVAGVQARGDHLAVRLSGTALPGGLTRGGCWIHVGPADRLEPLGEAATGLALENTIELRELSHGLRAGDPVFLGDGRHVEFAQVKEVRGRTLSLDRNVGPLDLRSAWMSRPRRLSVTRVGSRLATRGNGVKVALLSARVPGDYSGLIGTIGAHAARDGKGSLVEMRIVAAKFYPIDPSEKSPPAGRGLTHCTLESALDGDGKPLVGNPQHLLVQPVGRDWALDTWLEKAGGGSPAVLSAKFYASPPKKTSSGDLVVLASGARLAWGRLDHAALDPERGRVELQVKAWSGAKSARYYLAQTRVYGHFRERLRAHDWNRNDTPVAGQLTLAERPEGLVAGRLVVIEQEGPSGASQSRHGTIERVDGNDIFLAPDLIPAAGQGFTVSNTVIRGNVVIAGHGERRPERVLGSGSAALPNQAFVLPVPGVSFVADPAQDAGVRADIDLRVGEQVWEQVSRLDRSGSGDPHYCVRMTEEGHLRLEFGDGFHGRRLPTGDNNVRVVYREGNGLAGILDAGSLARLVQPHPLLEAARQPIPASGGNAPEGAASMRETAPRSVLALGRAVSLDDFANLAARNSRVWRARAFRLPAGEARGECVEVVVVPAGGTALGALGEDLRTFLETHAVPGVQIRVAPYTRRAPSLDVTLRVVSASFDPDRVVARVRDALLERFSLRRRDIGQPLYLSEIYGVVERVTGVENSVCVLDSVPGLSVIRAAARGEVICLNQAIAVHAEAYVS
jgi:hypothetical protein